VKGSLLIEFETPGDLARAVRQLRASVQMPGLELDAHTPYSTEEVREALALEPSPLPRIVFVAACLGAGGAYALEWLTTAHWYPVDVGGRPLHMPLAFVPIAFEMGVLAAALASFIGVLVGGKLVKLWDPVFEVPGFEGVSVDRFWLRVTARGELDIPTLQAELEAMKPLRHVLLEEV
jgi:hypothetical protein